MPGDWIKMRTDLYRDPKVCALADLLMKRDGELARYVDQMCQRDMTVTRNVTRCAVVGALVSVWGVLRHQGRRRGDDLVVDGVTAAVVDDIADLPGFGAAMEHVGWLEADEDGVTLPKFFRELNAEPVRSGAAERQKKYRERKRHGDVTRDVTGDGGSDVTSRVTVTGEKRERREEKKEEEPPNPPQAGGDDSKTPPTPPKSARAKKPPQNPESVALPAALDTPAFRSTWGDWLADRKARKNAVTELAARQQLEDLTPLGPERAAECVRESIRNGWAGLFPDKHRGGPPKPAGGFRSKAQERDDIFAQQFADAYGIDPGEIP
jgi:hypothetical protein